MVFYQENVFENVICILVPDSVSYIMRSLTPLPWSIQYILYIDCSQIVASNVPVSRWYVCRDDFE